MRKAGGPRKRPAGGIRWDEQNLEENEVIKATISKAKINEPKTPYHGPLGDQHMEEADDGLQPLQLDSHHHHQLLDGVATNNASDGVASGCATGTATETVGVQAAVDPTAGLNSFAGPGHSGSSEQASLHSQGKGIHAHFESSLLEAVAEPENRSGFSSDSELRASLTGGGDEDLDEEEGRSKFEQRRRAHYNMREALRRARVLLSEDGEGEPDADKDATDKDDSDDVGGATSNAIPDTAMSDAGSRGNADA